MYKSCISDKQSLLLCELLFTGKSVRNLKILAICITF